MSVFSYNGVTLPYCQCLNFQQQAMYDESRTDWFCMQYNITVQAVINTAYLEMVAPDLVGVAATTGAAEIMSVIRTRLFQPRNTLSFKFNDYELIPNAQSGNRGTVDALNGPHPQRCDISQLSSNTFLITYQVEAHYWETLSEPLNPEVDPINRNFPGNTFLYNRWSETVDIDAAQFTTRTRTGKCLIRSDNTLGVVADSVRRQMAVVGVPDGCVRKSSQYVLSPDGLGIGYTVVDREVFKFPPTGAYEAEGHYFEVGSSGNAKIMAVCKVKLMGSKTTPQAKLLQRCISIVIRKLAMNGAVIDGADQSSNSILSRSLLHVDMYNNMVEYEGQALIMCGKTRVAGPVVRLLGQEIQTELSPFTFTPFSDKGDTFPGSEQPTYPLRGTLNYFLKTANYYDPSVPGDRVSSETGQMGGLRPGEAGKEQEQ